MLNETKLVKKYVLIIFSCGFAIKSATPMNYHPQEFRANCLWEFEVATRKYATMRISNIIQFYVHWIFVWAEMKSYAGWTTTRRISSETQRVEMLFIRISIRDSDSETVLGLWIQKQMVQLSKWNCCLFVAKLKVSHN